MGQPTINIKIPFDLEKIEEFIEFIDLNSMSKQDVLRLPKDFLYKYVFEEGFEVNFDTRVYYEIFFFYLERAAHGQPKDSKKVDQVFNKICSDESCQQRIFEECLIYRRRDLSLKLLNEQGFSLPVNTFNRVLKEDYEFVKKVVDLHDSYDIGNLLQLLIQDLSCDFTDDLFSKLRLMSEKEGVKEYVLSNFHSPNLIMDALMTFRKGDIDKVIELGFPAERLLINFLEYQISSPRVLRKGFLKEIFKNGADPNMEDYYPTNNESILSYLVRNKDNDALNEFLIAGANPNQKDNNYGRRLIHHAVRSGNSGAVHILVKHGAKLNYKDKFGMTPLVQAIVNKDMKMAERLLKLGANPNTKSKYSMETAIDQLMTIAAKNACIKMLKKYEGDFEYIPEPEPIMAMFNSIMNDEVYDTSELRGVYQTIVNTVIQSATSDSSTRFFIDDWKSEL